MESGKGEQEQDQEQEISGLARTTWNEASARPPTSRKLVDAVEALARASDASVGDINDIAGTGDV